MANQNVDQLTGIAASAVNTAEDKLYLWDNSAAGAAKSKSLNVPEAQKLISSPPLQVALTAPGGKITANQRFYFDFPYAGNVTLLEVKANTAPTTSAANFDLSINTASWNGALATMLSAQLSLAADAFTASTTGFANAVVLAGSKGEILIAAADSGATCADAIAVVHLTRS
jgi:hypothetical protein